MAKHDGKGLLGGANANSLYIPMSETEQEVLDRLLGADDIEVCIVGWGVINKPRIVVGDSRVGCHLQVNFTAPAVPTPVYFFDLEMRTRAGLVLYRERQPCAYNGQPLQVCAGVTLNMVWDIAISHMDPKVVKALMPHAIGLTSRRQDRDTGQVTLMGNMHLNTKQQKAAVTLAATQGELRARDTHKNVQATKKAGYKVTPSRRGPVAPEVV